jgi:hypothetical protein
MDVPELQSFSVAFRRVVARMARTCVKRGVSIGIEVVLLGNRGSEFRPAKRFSV